MDSAALFLGTRCILTSRLPHPTSGSGIPWICVNAAQRLKVTEVTLISSALEQVWIKIALRGSDYLLVGCIYRSPSSNPDDSMRQLKLLLQQASSMSSHLVIVGDFNLPQIDWELELSLAPSTHCSHPFLDAIRDSFLFQHVRHPTRFRLGEIPNVLDLILINEEGMVRNLDHLSGLGSSDHVVLKFTLVCYTVVVSSAPSYRNITDYRLLSEMLSSIDWNQMDGMELEDSYKFFKSRINRAPEDCTKKRSFRSKKSIYMNRKALQLRKRKMMLWSTYCRTRNILHRLRQVHQMSERAAKYDEEASERTRTEIGYRPQAEPESTLEICQHKTPNENSR